MKVVNADGTAECLWVEDSYVQDAAVGGRLNVLFGDGALNEPQIVRQYDGQQWTDVASISGVEFALAIHANGDTIAVTGSNQLAMAGSASAGTLTPLPGVPAGDYTSVWVYAPNDIVLGNGLGHIARYNGATWTVIDTGMDGGIGRLWGADDGTVYFTGYWKFGRLVGDRAELITVPEAATARHYFVDLWGNSSSEVFVAVNDQDFGVYDCGETFMLWFDGSVFHQF